MKKNLLKLSASLAVISKVVLATMLLGMGIWSCDKKENEQEITLVAPENNATFNLSTTNEITFTWNRAEGVAAYTLRFSESATEVVTSNVKKELGDITSYVLTAQEAEQMMSLYTNVPPGQTGDIYWTVTGGDAQTQVRKFSVTRLPVAEDAYLNVSTHNMAFQASGGAQTVTIVSNTAWTANITQEGSWLSVAPQNGNGNGTITITAQSNPTNVARPASVILSGTGIESPETISATQAATGGGPGTDMLGTWYLKKAEQIEGFGPAKVNTEYLAEESFTLSEGGVFAGEIIKMVNSWNDNAGEITKTWTYEGSLFTYMESGNTLTYRATPSASELVFEIGQAGQVGYGKAVYTKTANTAPAFPRTITPYTGDESIFIGAWVMKQTESCEAEPDYSNPKWANVYFNVNDNLMTLTVNANHTFSMIQGSDSVSGTWSFNAATGTLTITQSGKDGTSNMVIDATSTASSFVWVEREDDTHGHFYSKTTLTKKN